MLFKDYKYKNKKNLLFKKKYLRKCYFLSSAKFYSCRQKFSNVKNFQVKKKKKYAKCCRERLKGLEIKENSNVWFIGWSVYLAFYLHGHYGDSCLAVTWTNRFPERHEIYTSDNVKDRKLAKTKLRQNRKRQIK